MNERKIQIVLKIIINLLQRKINVSMIVKEIIFINMNIIISVI